MEGTPNQTPENSLENKSNFHERSEKRKELRRAIAELGINPNPKTSREIPKSIVRKKKNDARAFIEELGLLDRKAKKFKIAD